MGGWVAGGNGPGPAWARQGLATVVDAQAAAEVDPPRRGGAGVLHDKTHIKWEKDRGKDVESAWYHLFQSDRISVQHLTLAEKMAA